MSIPGTDEAVAMVTLGLSVTVTGVVPSMVVSNVNIIVFEIVLFVVTVMISCTDTRK